MMGTTHLAIGALTGLLLFQFFNTNPYLFVFLAMIGALLADVDHEKSKINKLLPVTRWVPYLFKHRGFFHSIFPAVIILAVLYSAGQITIAIPLTIGYLSHLLTDCFTKQGCNLLHPISTLRIQGFMRTGGTAEFVILCTVLLIDLLLLAKFANLI